MRHPRTLAGDLGCIALPSPGTITALGSGCAQSEGQAAGSIAGEIASIGNLIPIPGVGSILSALGGIIGNLLAGPPENYPAYIYFTKGPIPRWIVGPTTNPDVVDVHGVYGGAQGSTEGAIIQVAATVQQWINNAVAAGFNFANSGAFQVMLGLHVPGTLWAAPEGAEWAPESSDHEVATVAPMDANALVQAVVQYLSSFATKTTTPLAAAPFVPSGMIGGQWAGGQPSPLAVSFANPVSGVSPMNGNIPYEPMFPLRGGAVPLLQNGAPASTTPDAAYADGYDGYGGANSPTCTARVAPGSSATSVPSTQGAGTPAPATAATVPSTCVASSSLIPAGLNNWWLIGGVGVLVVGFLFMSGSSQRRTARRRRSRRK